nr:MAG TPA_asm: hypothetical protein [Caudoviricetes sp.]
MTRDLSLRHGCAVPPPSSEGGLGTDKHTWCVHRKPKRQKYPRGNTGET